MFWQERFECNLTNVLWFFVSALWILQAVSGEQDADSRLPSGNAESSSMTNYNTAFDGEMSVKIDSSPATLQSIRSNSSFKPSVDTTQAYWLPCIKWSLNEPGSSAKVFCLQMYHLIIAGCVIILMISFVVCCCCCCKKRKKKKFAKLAPDRVRKTPNKARNQRGATPVGKTPKTPNTPKRETLTPKKDSTPVDSYRNKQKQLQTTQLVSTKNMASTVNSSLSSSRSSSVTPPSSIVSPISEEKSAAKQAAIREMLSTTKKLEELPSSSPTPQSDKTTPPQETVRVMRSDLLDRLKMAINIEAAKAKQQKETDKKK